MEGQNADVSASAHLARRQCAYANVRLGSDSAVPGLENTTWFKADEVGSYEGRSTAFSGPAYATMRARVNVVEPADYEIWLSDQAEGIQTAQAAVQERIESGTAPEEGVE